MTNLDERDIIHGGEDKLRQAILEADRRYHPRLIFLYTSCASGIIGDDIEAVTAELQREVAPLLVPIHYEGFKSKICASGFYAAFLAVTKYNLKDRRPPKEKGLINLFAPTSVSFKDNLEMERMLGVLGLHAT